MTKEIMLEIPSDHDKNIFGSFDTYLKKIEKTLDVDIIERNGLVKIIGDEGAAGRAENVLRGLLELSLRGNQIT